MSNADRLEDWFWDAMNESNELYIEDIRNESDMNSEYSNRLEEEMADAECETEEDFLDTV